MAMASAGTNRTDQQRRTLADLIGAIRRREKWTLRQMSERVGIPASTLAKIEGGKLSLSYEKLQALAEKLGMTMADFLTQDAVSAPGRPIIGRRSLMREDTSIFVQAANYDYNYLFTDLRGKKMVPMISRVMSRTIEDFGALVRHDGEEIVFVIEGCVEVLTEFYAPVILQTGQAIYIDSLMGHAYLACDCESALVLCVCASNDASLETTLIQLAEQDKVPG